MVFPKRVMLSVESESEPTALHRKILYPQGLHKVPVEYATHWWLAANKVTPAKEIFASASADPGPGNFPEAA
jgi:hypothetical protein